MSAQPQRICTSVCESVVPRCEHHLVMVVKMVVSNEAFPHLYQFLLTVTSLMVSDQLIQSSSAVVIKVSEWNETLWLVCRWQFTWERETLWITWTTWTQWVSPNIWMFVHWYSIERFKSPEEGDSRMMFAFHDFQFIFKACFQKDFDTFWYNFYVKIHFIGIVLQTWL